MSKAFVAILMGSDSDLPLLENTMSILKDFGIPYEVGQELLQLTVLLML